MNENNKLRIHSLNQDSTKDANLNHNQVSNREPEEQKRNDLINDN